MNLSSQVTSLELSKRLRELGVRSESLFSWFRKPYLDEIFEISLTGETYYKNSESFSAFTASELLELLPYKINDYNLLIKGVYYDDTGEELEVCYQSFSHDDLLCWEEETRLSNALAKMLIHLLENKLLEIK